MLLETDRLVIRKLSIDDAEFILELLNEPSFLQYIGDKGVRTLDDARKYIIEGPVDSYNKNGFGLYLVSLKDSAISIGMCGLVKRPALPDADIGFAFLRPYRSQGYGFESASAVMSYARHVLGLPRVLAITSPDNQASINLLQKIGLRFDKMIKLPEDLREIKLFTSNKN